MPLLTGSNAVNTVFTPAVGTFTVHVSGSLQLESRPAAGATWEECGTVEGRMDVNNPVAGTDYRWVEVRAGSFVSVRADQ